MISLPYAEESNMLSHLDTILKVVDEQTDRITTSISCISRLTYNKNANYQILSLILKHYQAHYGILLANIFLYSVSSIHEQF